MSDAESEISRHLKLITALRIVGSVLAMLAIILAAALYFGLPSAHVGSSQQQLTTGAGDMREITLGDNTLNVNEHTSLSITESLSGFHVTLKSGEAAFQTKNKNRPITVSTPDVEIRGDNSWYGIRTTPGGGTDITTSRDGSDTSIRCRLPDGGHKKLTLRSDQSVHINHNCELRLGLAANIQPPDLWPREELRFRNARLVDVIGDFNAYYQHPIRIESEFLSDEKISGSFDPMNQHALLEYVSRVYGAQVAQGKDGSTRLIGGSKRKLAAANTQ